MKIDIETFKPGASEFKRSEHIIKAYKSVLDAFAHAKEKGINASELNRDRSNGGRKLVDLYLKFGILKKEPLKFPWDDRLTSLFKRQKLITIDDDGFFAPAELGKFILQSYDCKPFSMSDFKLMIYMSNQESRGISFLKRAYNILSVGKMKTSSFYKEYILINYEGDKGKILELFSRGEEQTLVEIMKSGSNINEDTEEFVKNITRKLIKIFNSDSRSVSLANSGLLERNDNIRKWENFKETAIQSVTNLSKKELKDNADNIFFDKSDICDFVIYFTLSKKFSEYRYLVEKYVTNLPLFKNDGVEIQLNNKFKKTIENLITTKNILDIGDINEIYEQIVPEEERGDIIDHSKFYPEITMDFLETMISDYDLWVKKKNIENYKSVFKHIEKTNLPTYYEFVTILYLYKKIAREKSYYDFEKSINTSLSSEYMPVRFASGGRADAVISTEEEVIIIEPTIAKGRKLMSFEIGIFSHIDSHNADYCVLIAPEIEKEVSIIADKMRLQTNEHKGWTVYPIDNMKLLRMKNNIELHELKEYLEEA